MNRSWLLLCACSALALACDLAPSRPKTPPARTLAEGDPCGPAAEIPAEPGRFFVLPAMEGPELRPRDVIVRTPPPSTPAPPEGHPVLIVLDGQVLGDDGLGVLAELDRLVARGEAQDRVVVGVPSTQDRRRELPLSASGARAILRPAGRTRRARAMDERFVDWVLDDVLARVGERVPIDVRRDSVTVLGFSHGGNAALHFAMRRPDRVGRIVCFSPSLWWRDHRVAETFARAHTALPSRMWVDVGSLEGWPNQRVPYMVADARALREVAIRRGMVLGVDLGYAEQEGGEHTYESVRGRMPAALAFVLAPASGPRGRPVTGRRAPDPRAAERPPRAAAPRPGRAPTPSARGAEAASRDRSR